MESSSKDRVGINKGNPLQPDGDMQFIVKKQYSLLDNKLLPLTFDYIYPSYSQQKVKVQNQLCIRQYKYCLGVMKCSVCAFVAAPLQNRRKKKFGPPKEQTITCPFDSHPLVHQKCECLMQTLEKNKHWLVTHEGTHCHPVPPQIN